MRPGLLAGGGAPRGQLGGVEVVGRGVDEVAHQGDGVGDGAHPAEGGLGGGRGRHDDGELRRRHQAVGRQVGLVGGELVRAQQVTLTDGVQPLGVGRAADGGEQADDRPATAERPAGGTGGAAQRVGGIAAGGVGGAEAGDRDDRERTLAEGGEPGDLVLRAAGAEVEQGGQEPAAEQPVHRLRAGCGQQPVRALPHGDDDGVPGQLLQRMVGGNDRRRHRSILGAPLACPP